MTLFTSHRLIQFHAISVFILAYYLIAAPEVITTSSMVFMLGEAMHINPLPSHYLQSPPGMGAGSSLAICAILLVIEAVIDLILVGKLPKQNEVLSLAEEIQRSQPRPNPSASSSVDKIMGGDNGGYDDRAYGDISARDNQRANPFMVQLANLYSDIWTVLAAVRFCLFFGVAMFIYQSQILNTPSKKNSGWQHTSGGGGGGGGGGGSVGGGLDQLKNRVVFTYAFTETMFWLWMLLKLREERFSSSVRFVPQGE